MLADEVTHVKMGSDWLRRLTANDPERQKQALDFQRTVDKLFSFGGFRGEEDENPVHLARKFRALAGFTDDEITDLVDVAAEAYAEAAGDGRRPPPRPAPPARLQPPLTPPRRPRRLGVGRRSSATALAGRVGARPPTGCPRCAPAPCGGSRRSPRSPSSCRSPSASRS